VIHGHNASARQDYGGAAKAFARALQLKPGDTEARSGLDSLKNKAHDVYLQAYTEEQRDPDTARKLYNTVLLMVPPGADVTIGQTGVVSADGVPIDRIALFELQGNIVRIGPQLYASGAGGTVTPTEGGVSTGQLEMGNVTPLESTVQMINAQRQYETAMQAIQTYRTLDARVIEVGRVR